MFELALPRRVVREHEGVAHAAGVGATINARIGGKTDPDQLGAPIEVEAYVKSVTDGRFITQSPMGRGSLQDLGRMARLIVGGIDILVGSESPPWARR